MNLVIVAGGLGSRLAPMTNQIPKFLVNIGKNTGYVEMIRYWKKYSPDSITVIVHSKYAGLVAEYHAMYFKEIPLIIKTVDEANGSAHAILNTCEHLVNRRVLFTWCDVIPVDDINYKDIGFRFGPNVIFTNYNNSNRYALQAARDQSGAVIPVISEEQRGGCFGMYFISQFKTAGITFKDGQDFIEIMEQYGRIYEHRVKEIIDFGDLPKLKHVRSKSDEAREFNSIEIVGDYVLKKATNEQGRAIIEREVQWYSALNRLSAESKMPVPASVPRTWIASDNRSFFMSKVEGVPVWKAWNDLSDADRLYVIKQIVTESQKIFDLGKYTPDPETVEADITAEVETKLTKRYLEIKGMIDSFGNIRTVNRCWIENDPIKIYKLLNKKLTEHYRENAEYGFIHGDLQFSNSMVNLDTMKVSIIDPRGYFGNTVGAGLRDYDTGKLSYALSGYDGFNYSSDFGIQYLNDSEIKFDIHKATISGAQYFINDHFQPIHYLWRAVCWLGLAQYIKNDPVKSVCAHYHGMMLARICLNL